MPILLSRSRLVLLIAALSLSGCASFSPDGGMTAVSDLASQTIKKDVAFVRSADEAGAVERRGQAPARPARSRPTRQCRSHCSATRVCRPPITNWHSPRPTWSSRACRRTRAFRSRESPAMARARSNGRSSATSWRSRRCPFRSDIERDRFRQAQLKAALETLRLAAEVRRAYFRAVAANELVGLLTDAKSTAEATAQLARKLGETGSINKLDQAREQVFYAEMTADLATARQNAASARERLARLMGLWDGDLGLPIPNRLPPLPRQPACPARDRSRCRRPSHRSADRAHRTGRAGEVA